MNVILEGSDGGGKSTLASTLSNALDMRVKQGSGPPRQPGEIEARLRSYLELDDVIFDRHPAISQPIYGALRDEPLSLEFLELERRFYDQPSLIIYCRSTDVSRHRVKPGENPEHIAKLTANYALLVQLYDSWALKRAHMMYRIGDDPEVLIDIVRVMAC